MPETALSIARNNAAEIWDGLTVPQQAALIVLADGKPHYCRGCVNAKATSRLRTLKLARTISYGDAFTGDTVEITDAGQAVFDGSI